MSVDPSFAEQFGLVLGALATLITAIGGVAIVKGRREARAGDGASAGAALKAAVDRQTEILRQDSQLHARDRTEMIRLMRELHLLAVELRARRD